MSIFIYHASNSKKKSEQRNTNEMKNNLELGNQTQQEFVYILSSIAYLIDKTYYSIKTWKSEQNKFTINPTQEKTQKSCLFTIRKILAYLTKNKIESKQIRIGLLILFGDFVVLSNIDHLCDQYSNTLSLTNEPWKEIFSKFFEKIIKINTILKQFNSLKKKFTVGTPLMDNNEIFITFDAVKSLNTIEEKAGLYECNMDQLTKILNQLQDIKGLVQENVTNHENLKDLILLFPTIESLLLYIKDICFKSETEKNIIISKNSEGYFAIRLYNILVDFLQLKYVQIIDRFSVRAKILKLNAKINQITNSIHNSFSSIFSKGYKNTINNDENCIRILKKAIEDQGIISNLPDLHKSIGMLDKIFLSFFVGNIDQIQMKFANLPTDERSIQVLELYKNLPIFGEENKLNQAIWKFCSQLKALSDVLPKEIEESKLQKIKSVISENLLSKVLLEQILREIEQDTKTKTISLMGFNFKILSVVHYINYFSQKLLISIGEYNDFLDNNNQTEFMQKIKNVLDIMKLFYKNHCSFLGFEQALKKIEERINKAANEYTYQTKTNLILSIQDAMNTILQSMEDFASIESDTLLFDDTEHNFVRSFNKNTNIILKDAQYESHHLLPLVYAWKKDMDWILDFLCHNSKNESDKLIRHMQSTIDNYCNHVTDPCDPFSHNSSFWSISIQLESQETGYVDGDQVNVDENVDQNVDYNFEKVDKLR